MQELALLPSRENRIGPISSSRTAEKELNPHQLYRKKPPKRTAQASRPSNADPDIEIFDHNNQFKHKRIKAFLDEITPRSGKESKKFRDLTELEEKVVSVINYIHHGDVKGKSDACKYFI